MFRQTAATAATLLAASATLLPLFKPDASRDYSGSPCLQGFFSDWREWSNVPGQLRTTGAFISDADGASQPSQEINLVGSDEGDKFWSLRGRFTDSARSKFIVDFSPKGGPANLFGYCSGADQIRWADGNSWWREPLQAGWARDPRSLASLKYLSQSEAAEVDAALMPTPGLTVERHTRPPEPNGDLRLDSLPPRP